ncbi:hypothetical protein ASPZODRAFT_144403 [Penicilliopsis zonata CBS 506.65]|uniref:Rhodopsin domain-containing protein n=1 Tax=Penicilliopsis zonata CBS 506.65 TaxID=1073090 RepID=A0A1L9SD54_9EURO|nr:hypothetical protein ASPZODRAFT_144403 [Penicilliopsis zonata CBS 506.65]OJJ45099.1 hypothetical protein ASPZODRAFT_144403 [Penicilliopsis zonata CBS 506.65]
MSERVQITATNKSPLLLIVTWLLLVLAAFAYIVRSIVKLSRQAMRLEWDDYLLTGALVFCTAQSLATIIRAADGFGQPLALLSTAKVEASMQAALAASILYVLSLALSKISLLALLAKLSPNRRHRRVMHGIALFVAVFTSISVFVVSFSCSVPNTWDYTSGRCINRPLWWTFFDVYNIATESALIVIPIYIIGLVQWPLARKVVFSIPFVLRTCTIAACIADMLLWHRLSSSPDPFFAEWPVSVTTQTIQCSCLASTCILYLRNFLSSVETGFGLDGDLSASIPLELRTATVGRSGYNLSSEGLTGSASMPGQIKVTTRYEVREEVYTVLGGGHETETDQEMMDRRG